MKHFFKILFGSCLGTILGITLLGLIILGILSITNRPATELKEQAILKLDLNEFIPEITGNVTQEGFPFATGENIGLREIKKVIRQAAKDPKVEGIYVHTKFVQAGQATLKEIREELLAFKESEKFIWAYSDYYSQSAYWLSSVADSVFLNPNGTVNLKGFGASITFFKGLMDKTGVEMNIFYAGKFKSYTEPFRRKDMSPENREQIKSFLENMQEIMYDDIGKSRHLTYNELKEISQDYKGGFPETCLQSGLVDELIYRPDFEKKLKAKIGKKTGEKLIYTTLSEYNSYLKIEKDYNVKEKIAVIYAEGDIMNGTSDKGIISEKRYAKIFDKIRKDKNVKGVVLRINSPGGNSFDSDNINQEVKILKESGIPVMASFGDYAASGGYYIAASCDTIIAEPNTLTGSIGVFLMFPNISDLLEEKLGISHDTVKTDPMAIGFTPYLDLSEKEKNYLQKTTDDLYQRFIQIVAEGRNMTMEEVDKIAQGRVWTGKKAKELGLVDALGGLEETIEITATAANLDKYRIDSYPKIEKSALEQIALELINREVKTPKIEVSPFELEMLGTYHDLKSFISDQGPKARLPYVFHWN